MPSELNPAPGRPVAAHAGFSLVEALVAVLLTLVVMSAVYEALLASRRQYASVNDLVIAQTTGRALLERFTADALAAGYNPRGARLLAVPQGDAARVRILADLDGSGDVTTAGQPDGENVTWEFVGPDGTGAYQVRRGYDLNGDGLYTGPGERVDVLCTTVVPIDVDADGKPDPFLSYDAAPPASRQVRISFGIRTERVDPVRGRFQVIDFDSRILLRNRV